MEDCVKLPAPINHVDKVSRNLNGIRFGNIVAMIVACSEVFITDEPNGIPKNPTKLDASGIPSEMRRRCLQSSCCFRRQSRVNQKAARCISVVIETFSNRAHT